MLRFAFADEIGHQGAMFLSRASTDRGALTSTGVAVCRHIERRFGIHTLSCTVSIAFGRFSVARFAGLIAITSVSGIESRAGAPHSDRVTCDIDGVQFKG